MPEHLSACMTTLIVIGGIAAPNANHARASESAPPTFSNGQLDTVEKQASFWRTVTGTDFTLGASGFTLSSDDTMEPLSWTILASDSSNDLEPWPVGTITARDLRPSGLEFDPTVVVHDDASVGGLRICLLELWQVDGVAVFDSGQTVRIGGNLLHTSTLDPVSNTETMHPIVMVPHFVERILLSQALLVGDPERKNLEVGPGNAGGTNQPCNRVWTWCRDEAGFCADMAQCYTDYQRETGRALRAREACLIAAEVGYLLCMGECIVDGELQSGLWCAVKDIGCSAAEGSTKLGCRTAYAGLAAAADWNFHACASAAKRNNGRQVRGCNCPGSMVPFPTQTPPRWGDVDCDGYLPPGVDWQDDILPWL